MEDEWSTNVNTKKAGKSFSEFDEINELKNGNWTDSGWDENVVRENDEWDEAKATENGSNAGWDIDTAATDYQPYNKRRNDNRDDCHQGKDKCGFGRGGGSRGFGRSGGSRGFGRGGQNRGVRARNQGDSNYRNENNANNWKSGFEDNDNQGDIRGGRNGNGDRAGQGTRGKDKYDNDDNDDTGKETKVKREFYIPPEPTEDENEIFNSGISSGINFDKYDKIPISVSGEKVPSAIKSFEKSGLRDFLLTNIKKSGYIKPTPVQKNAIPIIMEGRDLMGCAQTGSGKTAAFLLPIINDLLTNNKSASIGRPQALIISPTRELAIQIFVEARKFSMDSFLKVSLIYGGTAVKYQGDNIQKGCNILVATPGRLLHFLNLGHITFEDIRFVVLDEADRMLDMGFMPDVEKIMENPTMPSVYDKQTLMFSATFPDDIQELAGKFLNNYIFLAIGTVGGACSDVEQKFYQVTKYEKRAKLTELLEQSSNGTIVFVETKRNADFLASILSEIKFPTTSIHGDRLQRERELALKDFKSGKMAVLTATSVAARGLDIKNVEHVINYDLPKNIEDYVHRIGRTGRVGNCGRASSFFDPDQDADLAPHLVKILRQADQYVPDFLLNVEVGKGGGSGTTSKNRFGGHDIRNNVSRELFGSEPQELEPEEEW